jgi:hypothetical protein
MLVVAQTAEYSACLQVPGTRQATAEELLLSLVLAGLLAAAAAEEWTLPEVTDSLVTKLAAD